MITDVYSRYVPGWLSIDADRGKVLDAAYAANPERFVNKPPQPPKLADAAWINRPVHDPTGTLHPTQ